MKRLFLILAALSYSTIGDAQTKSDEDAVRALPRAFCEAWAKHDGHQLATIMAEDVDFVTVGGAWFHGRADFEKYHTRLLSGRFRDSTNTPLETIVRFLRPDEAVVHWKWTIEGDKNPDGSPRPKRHVVGSWSRRTQMPAQAPPKLTTSSCRSGYRKRHRNHEPQVGPNKALQLTQLSFSLDS